MTELSKNALTTLEKRYFQQGEDWDGLCRRVANAVADAEPGMDAVEIYRDEFFDVMNRLDFLPSSPVLMNAGTDNQMLAACISGDTYVYTQTGLKYMRDIHVGDKVLTHLGNFKRVINVWSNGEKETINMAHGKTTIKYSNLTCTPDHKIYNTSNDWERADCIHKTESIMPSLWKSMQPYETEFTMSNYVGNVKNDTIVIDGRLHLLQMGERGKRGILNKQTNSCVDVVANDDVMARLFGLFLADGNICESAIRYCFNEADTKNIDFVVNNLGNKFGCRVVAEKSNFGKWVTIKMHCRFAANLFKEQLGVKFNNKKIPEWVANAPTQYKQNMFDGLMNDGHRFKHGAIRLCLANPTLVYQSVLLGRELGYISNFKSDARERLSKSPTSRAYFLPYTHDVSGRRTQINDIVRTHGEVVEVFDMEVEDDHSFVAGDFIVHNCFVLGIDDNMDSIFTTLHDSAIIFKSGGGVGYDFSKLRAKESKVQSTNGVASGPVSFISVFDKMTDVIKAGGKRRGASMGVLRCDHPDIMDFITCKNDNNAINNFNLSVALTNEFMDDVVAGGESEVFDAIVHQAWTNGEPGMLFIDKANESNPTPHIGKFCACNPCGETFLLSGEACILGSINLSNMVTNGVIDYDRLRTTVWTGVRFLDNCITVSEFPFDYIKEAVNGNRKIGIGVMGFADMLIKLGIVYGSDESLTLASRVMSTIESHAIKASMFLADEKGAYPNLVRPSGIYGIRNATVTTIAPTGSISIIAGCSGGIEPLYALNLGRGSLDGELGDELYKPFEVAMREHGFSMRDTVQVAKDGVVYHHMTMPSSVEPYVTAHEVSPENHVRMLAAFQAHVDNAVSKSVNLPNSATEQDVRDAIILAYKLGCKGLTVYRDGSREQVLTHAGTETESHGGILAEQFDFNEDADAYEASKVTHMREIPTVTEGKTHSKPTGCGTLHVTINEDSRGVCEVFGTLGKAGGCPAAHLEAQCRMISMGLRSGNDVNDIIDQLRGISCPNATITTCKSCSDAIGAALSEHCGSDDRERTVAELPPCTECGGSTIPSGSKCAVCTVCGHGGCS